MSLKQEQTGGRRINFLGVLAVLVLAAGAAFGVRYWHGAQVRKQADLFLELADQADAQKDVEGAIANLERYCQFQPRDSAAAARLALNLKSVAKSPKDSVRALVSLENAFRLLEAEGKNREKAVEVRRALVELALLPGFDQFCDPLPHLEALAGEFPAESSHPRNIGMRRLKSDETAAAVAAFQEALKRDPTDADAAIALARTYRNILNKPADVKKVVHQLMSAGARNVRVQLAAADFWREAGEAAERLKAVEAALAIAPADATALAAAIDARLEDADKNRAKSLLETALAAHPKKPEFHRLASVLRGRLGDPKGAEQALRTGLAACGPDRELLWLLAESQLARDDGAEIESHVKALKSLGVAAPLLELLEARRLVANKDWKNARDRLAKVAPDLAGAPRAAIAAALAAGRCNEELGDTMGAEREFRRAVSLDPANAFAAASLARVLGKSGRFEEAAAFGKRAAEQIPEARSSSLRFSLSAERSKTLEQRQWKAFDKELDAALAAARSPDAELELGLILVETRITQSRFREASEAASKLAVKFPKSLPARLTLAKAAAASGNANDAKVALDEVRSAFGDSADLRLTQAMLATSLASLDSLALGEEKLNPQDRIRLLYGLVEARMRHGDPRGAAALCEKLVALRPDDIGIQRLRMDLALRNQDETARDKALAALVHLDVPGGLSSATAVAMRAMSDYRKNRDPALLEQASKTLVAAIRAHGERPILVYLEAQVADMESRTDAAADKYLRSFELGLLDKSLLARPLQLLSGRRRYRDAQRIISKLTFGAEDGPLAKFAVEICLHTGDVKRATELFSIAAARPDSKEVHDWLWTAGTAAALGDRSRAESALAKARELAPTKPEPWTLSVRFLAAMGRKDEAKKLLEEASKKFPATETDLPFGLCLHALGESVEGDRRLEAALAKRPDDAGTLRAIAEFRIAENDFAKGRPLLERIVRVAKPESPDIAWAQRLLAVASATTGVGEARVAALKALGIAEGAGDSVTAGTAEELRVRAAVLASIPGFRRRKEAVAIFERLSAESGFSKADELVLCSLYESVGDWPAAKSRLLGIAGSAGAPSAAALSALVRGILSRDRDAKAAEPWLARLERESPKSAAIVPLRALALKLGSGESAAETYVRAEVAEKLDSPEAAADLLIGIGARDAAERILRTASAGGNKPEASRRLAELVGARGRTAEALEICKGLRGKLPPLVVAQSFVIALNAADSVSTIDAAEFESWLERSLAKPEEADAKALFLAFLRTKQGRFADAMKLYQEILRRVPTHQMALNNGGFVAAFGLGDPVEGERMVDRAIAAYGVQPSLANTRGVIRLKLAATKPEKLADAIDDLSESVRMKPSGETSFQLARASLVAGKDKEARERWSEVLATGLTPYEVNDAFRAEFKSLMQRFK